jgi:leucine dehydrogenase
MTVFGAKDFDDHEQVVFHADPESGLRAIIAVHNTNLGPAFGGCRMRAYTSDADAIADVLRLSRGMTYKAAISNLPFGGGKSVIIGDPGTQKTDALLQAMGRFIHSLGGLYLTAEDVGTTVADMDILRRETPFAHGVSDGSGNPSPATAFGVYTGIRAAARHRLGRDDVQGLEVSVQGLGNVGYKLCEYLCEGGARLTVTDVDQDVVGRAVEEFSATAVDPDQIHAVAADVFAPCALGAIINDETLPSLRVSIVAGAANNQLAKARHGEALKARGILYAPDYVINAGGLIDVGHEGPDYDPDQVLKQVEGIYDTLMEIFETAEHEKRPTDCIADEIAEARFQSIRQPVKSQASRRITRRSRPAPSLRPTPAPAFASQLKTIS